MKNKSLQSLLINNPFLSAGTVTGLILIIVSVITIGITSCGPTRYQTESQEYIKNGTDGYYYKVCVIEGCEYIVCDHTNYKYSNWGSHKGDCKNPIHKKQ